MDLPLPPSRFVVAPSRITKEQRKAEKKNKGVKGPKYRKVNKAPHWKLIHKLHLKEQEEKGKTKY
jgi:hypothetical protein